MRVHTTRGSRRRIESSVVLTARFLITGRAGFIGSHLADELLRPNHEVVVLDELSTGRKENLASGIQLFVGDVLNVELVEKLAIGCMGIFHLAAIASVPRCNDSWVDSHRINQTGTVAVLNASRMSGLIGAGQSIAPVTATLGLADQTLNTCKAAPSIRFLFIGTQLCPTLSPHTRSL